MNGGLSDKGHSHMTVPDMEVESAGPLPAKGLIGVKKFFAVPTFRIMLNWIIDCGSCGGAQKSIEFEIIVSFSETLNDLVIRAGATPFSIESAPGSSITNPMPGEGIRRKLLKFLVVELEHFINMNKF